MHWTFEKQGRIFHMHFSRIDKRHKSANEKCFFWIKILQLMKCDLSIIELITGTNPQTKQ